MPVYIHIGKILKGHGLKGEVKLHSAVESVAALPKGATLRIQPPQGEPMDLELLSIRGHGYKLLATFRQIHDRSQADLLAGSTVAVQADVLYPDGNDELSPEELIGFDVFADKGEPIGKVEDVWLLPANDVLQVMHRGKEVLIPIIDDVIREVDTEQGRIIITVLDGLLE